MEWLILFTMLIITWGVKVMPWSMTGYAIAVFIVTAIVAVMGLPLWFWLWDRRLGHE